MCAKVLYAGLVLASPFFVFQQTFGQGNAIPEEQSRYLAVNPYSSVKWEKSIPCKANLHTHTLVSDGRYVPSAVIDMYANRAYDVLALTDHDYFLYESCTWPWTNYNRNPDALGMMAVPGMEMTLHHHMLSLFITNKPASYTPESALVNMSRQGGLAVMCHPSLHWPKIYPMPSLQIPMNSSLRGLTQGDFTAETWFSTTSSAGCVLIGSYTYAGQGAINLELRQDNGIRIYLQAMQGGLAITQVLVSAGQQLGINTRDGAWHHIAATRSGTLLALYLDGRLAGVASNAGVRYNQRSDYLYLGRDSRTGTPDVALRGALDDTRIWARALSSNEVNQLASGRAPGAENGPTRDGLLAEYRYESSEDEPLTPGMLSTGRVDDTAGHASGPLHAGLSTSSAGTYITNTPPALAQSGFSSSALLFGVETFPEQVPDDAVKFYADQFAQFPHLTAMEVFNGTVTNPAQQKLDQELWDRLLKTHMPHRPIWGVAVDDMHWASHFQKGWIVLPVARRTLRHIQAALSQGAYYCCTTWEYAGDGPDAAKVPRIENILHDESAGTITIQATVSGEALPEAACRWIADGQVVHEGFSLNYRKTAGIGSYVRAEIMGPGGKTFTNPFGLEIADNSPVWLVRSISGVNPGVSWETGGQRSAHIAGYVVYRSTDGVLYTNISGNGVSGTSWQDVSAAGSEYWYAIAPVYEGNPYVYSPVLHPCNAPAYRDSTGEGLPDYWKAQYGFSVHSTAGNDGAAGDPDSDGLSNLQEYIAGSNPRNAASRFSLESFVAKKTGGLKAAQIRFEPARPNRRYILQHRTRLEDGAWEDVDEQRISADEDACDFQLDPAHADSHYYRVKAVLP